MSEEKFYKNPARGKEVPRRVNIPAHIQMEIEPEIHHSVKLPPGMIISRATTSEDNPRLKNISVRQPYATPTESPLGKGPIPNVGNNIEHTWSAADVYDDLTETDLNTPMIDNNDFVIPDMTNNQSPQALEGDVKPGEYILLVEGSLVAQGTAEEIRKQTEQLLFGEHEICNGQSIELEQINVFKKINIKVGVSLD